MVIEIDGGSRRGMPAPSRPAGSSRSGRTDPAGTAAGALRRAYRALRDEEGATTAEYAVIIMAAVGFAGLLVAILRGNEVRGMLVDLVRNALGSAG